MWRQRRAGGRRCGRPVSGTPRRQVGGRPSGLRGVSSRLECEHPPSNGSGNPFQAVAGRHDELEELGGRLFILLCSCRLLLLCLSLSFPLPLPPWRTPLLSSPSSFLPPDFFSPGVSHHLILLCVFLTVALSISLSLPLSILPPSVSVLWTKSIDLPVTLTCFVG